MIVAYPDGSSASVSPTDATRLLQARPDARVLSVTWDGEHSKATHETRHPTPLQTRCRTLAALSIEERLAIAEAALSDTIDGVAVARGLSKSSVLKIMREFSVRKR